MFVFILWYFHLQFWPELLNDIYFTGTKYRAKKFTLKSVIDTILLNILKHLKTRPGDLVIPDPFAWFLNQNVDYFRPYKNHVKPGYKGHSIKFMVVF